MQRQLQFGVLRACAAAASLLLTVSIASAETFTATATVKTAAGGSGSTTVTFTVNQFSTDAERDALLAAVRKGGTPAGRELLAGAKDLGTVQVFDKTTPIKYAYARSMGASRLITIVTAQPVHFVTAGMTEQKPKEGYDLALAVFEVNAAGTGSGELSPAAKVKIDEKGSVVTEDYGAEVVRLASVGIKK